MPKEIIDCRGGEKHPLDFVPKWPVKVVQVLNGNGLGKEGDRWLSVSLSSCDDAKCAGTSFASYQNIIAKEHPALQYP